MPKIRYDAFPLGATHVARVETHINDPVYGDSSTQRRETTASIAIVPISGGPSMILHADALHTLREKLIAFLPLDDAFFQKHVVPRIKDRITAP